MARHPSEILAKVFSGYAHTALIVLVHGYGEPLHRQSTVAVGRCEQHEIVGCHHRYVYKQQKQ